MTAQMARESARYATWKIRNLCALYDSAALAAAEADGFGNYGDLCIARQMAWTDLENYVGSATALNAWENYRREIEARA